MKSWGIKRHWRLKRQLCSHFLGKYYYSTGKTECERERERERHWTEGHVCVCVCVCVCVSRQEFIDLRLRMT